MNKGSFFKALGVLAQSPGMQRYLNVLKPVTEGIQTKGMDFFNLAVKKVVDEGDQIETSLTTKKYVHPDRPDIFVEIDTSTGNANVGLVDPEAGAFAYTDEMKKENLISSLEDEGLGFGGSRVEAERLLKLRKEKAEAMKEIGKSKIKNKRQAMIDAYNRIIREKNKKADGGRVGMFMGGKLPQGAGLLRQMIKMIAKEQGLENPSEMLRKYNPKRMDRLLNDPDTLLKADIKEGIMATDKLKNLKNTAEAARIDMVTHLLDVAKQLRETNLTKEAQNDLLIKEALKLGMDREQAVKMVKSLEENMEKTMGLAPNLPKPTEQGILELETILKNLKTSGKSKRSLNADGGYIGLKDGGEVNLTVIEIPDISGSGVETLFKKR